MDEEAAAAARAELEQRRMRAADELTGLLLDHLGPALERLRSRTARRLGLSARELHCLDLLRRGPIPSSVIGRHTGLTRSAVAKMLRRLEAAGHLQRGERPGDDQELDVELLPHTERDAALDQVRARVHRAVRDAVATLRLDDEDRLAATAGLLIHACASVHEVTAGFAEAEWHQRRLERLRKERAAAIERKW